jgi:hypothetical protein
MMIIRGCSIGPLETWKKAALRKIQALKNTFKIRTRLYVVLVNHVHEATSLDCSLVRVLEAFDGEDEDLVEMLKATFSNHVPLSNPPSSQ